MEGLETASSTMKRLAMLSLSILIVLTLVSCGPEKPTPKEVRMSLTVSSTAFKEEEGIPTKYTCKGQNMSPPLTWGDPPEGTKAFALIVDDPDAPRGVFTHWVLFNIPADSRELAEAVPTQDRLPDGSLQGKNDFGKVGYGGPCPPPGPAHRYRFTVYALDSSLDLKPGATKEQVLKVMEGHTLAQGQLTGTYKR